MAKSKTNENEVTTVSFTLALTHKALIEAACARESEKVGRKYTLAEYFRDSALAYVAKDVAVPDHNYARGRKAAA